MPGSLAPLALTKTVEQCKAVQRTAGLPRNTRSVLLPGLAGNEHFYTQHERHVDNLFHMVLSSCNTAFSFITMKAHHDTVGTLSLNWAFLSTKYQDSHLIWDSLVSHWYTLSSKMIPWWSQTVSMDQVHIESMIWPWYLNMCPYIHGFVMFG